MIFADTNVILDVVTNDPHWREWSARQIEIAAIDGPVLIDAVVYAELGVQYRKIEQLDELVTGMGLVVAQAPRQALFLAAKAFRQYRQRGGVRTGVLPDFFIGAHAQVLGLPLLTRDRRRYREYFPLLELIGPDR